MNRTISCLLVLSFMLAICGASSSAQTNNNIFHYDNCDVIVENSDLSYEKKMMIADNIAGTNTEKPMESDSSTYNLLCVFGHKKVVSEVTEVRHNVYNTTPKCVQNIYDITTCERENCDFFESEVISSIRTAACHG